MTSTGGAPHPDRTAWPGRGSPHPWDPGLGGGSRAVSLQLAPLGAVAKTRRVDSVHWRRRSCRRRKRAREQPAPQVFPVHKEVFLPPAGPQRLASSWGERVAVARDARPGASGAAAGWEREMSPFATPAPAGHSGDRRPRPSPAPGGRAGTWLINFLNPPWSLPPPVVGLGME